MVVMWRIVVERRIDGGWRDLKTVGIPLQNCNNVRILMLYRYVCSEFPSYSLDFGVFYT